MNSAELSRRWTMTRRRASKMIPPHWMRKPSISNLISPKEAITTPITMIATLPRVLKLAGAMPKAQVAKRVTTAFVAYKINSWNVFGNLA